MDEASEESKCATYASEIVHWLKAQPQDMVVAWTSPNTSRDEPIATGFADIEVPELLEELRVMWLWTIVDPSRAAVADGLTIVLEKDHDQGWSPEQISRGIEQWVHLRSGRRDIRIQWDPDIESMITAVVKEAERRSMTEPKLQIGEGLYASNQAMDALLQMPLDDAAEITQTMQAIADEHQSDPERTD